MKYRYFFCILILGVGGGLKPAKGAEKEEEPDFLREMGHMAGGGDLEDTWDYFLNGAAGKLHDEDFGEWGAEWRDQSGNLSVDEWGPTEAAGLLGLGVGPSTEGSLQEKELFKKLMSVGQPAESERCGEKRKAPQNLAPEPVPSEKDRSGRQKMIKCDRINRRHNKLVKILSGVPKNDPFFRELLDCIKLLNSPEYSVVEWKQWIQTKKHIVLAKLEERLRPVQTPSYTLILESLQDILIECFKLSVNSAVEIDPEIRKAFEGPRSDEKVEWPMGIVPQKENPVV